jgi:hypothetical protein
MMLVVEIPIQLVNPLNGSHGHWSKRAKRAKEERTLAGLMTRSLGFAPPLPCTITITRIAPRALDDDNLAASAKHVRDGIADALEIKDNDPRVQWCYAQRKGKPKEYAVEIAFEATGARRSA